LAQRESLICSANCGKWCSWMEVFVWFILGKIKCSSNWFGRYLIACNR
jgi:hypothetical protein